MNRRLSLCLACVVGFSLGASARAATGGSSQPPLYKFGSPVLNFGPQEIIKAKGQEIVVPGYSVPSFEDWNNDRLPDLIVGEGGRTALGKIRVYLNHGTIADPCFTDYFYVQAGGRDLTCTPGSYLGCSPRVIHWDADARKDLLVGLADGRVMAFTNIGTDIQPVFDLGKEVNVGPSWAEVPLNVSGTAVPLLLDWNNDGMLDIVAGGEDGALHLYINCGCGGSVPPRFSFSTYNGDLTLDADQRVPSGCCSPVVVDLDGDGNRDVLVGNAAGQILFYRNFSVDTAPSLSTYSVVRSAGQPIALRGSLCSRPFICHWTGSPSWDLLVGYGDGKIRLYRGLKRGDFNGNGTLDADDLTALIQALDQPVGADGSLYDLNFDGVVDILDLRLFADLWQADHATDKK